jgi:8-oxo-dGTP pyrophosphatase MutT (NUDIX family)/dephospho-CoA kinase
MREPALILLAGTTEAGKSTAGRYLAGRGVRRVKIRPVLLGLTSGRPVAHEGVVTRECFDHDEFLARLRDLAAAAPEAIVAVESFIDVDLAETIRTMWTGRCVIVFVDADRTVRVRRLVEAGGLGQARSAAIIDAKDHRKRVGDQWSAWRRLADNWIDNDHSIAHLHRALDVVVTDVSATASPGETAMRTYMSAGAVVLSHDTAKPRVLLLHQVRRNGDHQVVAPKGGLEPGESPLAAAAREVTEEAGVRDLSYVGFLGRQSYEFVDDDGTQARKAVEWFLVATDDEPAPARDNEGFQTAELLSFDDASAAATHAEFRPFLHHARDLIEWRHAGRLPYSRSLSDLVWFLADGAGAVLADAPLAGIALCGSAARGDFVDGWSDVDLVAWGIDPTSPTGRRLAGLADQVEARWGIHTSLRVTDHAGRDANGSGPLYDMKLHAVLSRAGLDLPVIAGSPPETTAIPRRPLATVANIDLLHQFAAERVRRPATSAAERIDRARRALSVLCSASRVVADSIAPGTSLRLPAVAAVLEACWPDTQAVRVLAAYDRFRQAGATDLAAAEDLSHQAPDALQELRGLVEDLTMTV